MKRSLMISSSGNVSGRKMRELSTNKIAVSIMDIMQKHIGYEKAITREALFKKLFNEVYDTDRLDHYMLNDFMKRAMHLLRQKSNCFVSIAQEQDTYLYFVVKKTSDAEYYTEFLDRNIERMRYMQKRAKKAADEKWYKQTWALKSPRIHKQLSN